MFKTFKNAWKTPELKTKLLFTFLIIILFRLGSLIAVPWRDPEISSTIMSTGALAFFNNATGGALSQGTLFALGVSPYITSSIIIQLLTIVIPKLEEWSKEGEEGRKKISALTRIITIVLAFIMSVGFTFTMISEGMTTLTTVIGENMYWAHDTSVEFTGVFGAGGIFANAWFPLIVMVTCYCAGASIVMWMAERINDHGIGNGISIILFAGIIAGIPSTISLLVGEIYNTNMGFEGLLTWSNWSLGWIIASVVILAVLVVAVFFMIWVTNSERRIPIQYAKRVVGRKMYGGQSSNLPLKLNMSGVMPVIFASSIVSIPATIAQVVTSFDTDNTFFKNVGTLFENTKPLYIILFAILLVAFAYFYIMISFNPVEVANNIKNNGGAIPGIRPGRPTIEYIKKTLNRVTLIGAVFLIAIAVIPMIAYAIFYTVIQVMPADSVNITYGGLTALGQLSGAGTSILIVVGVVLETEREIESQLTLRNYKGFLD